MPRSILNPQVNLAAVKSSLGMGIGNTIVYNPLSFGGGAYGKGAWGLNAASAETFQREAMLPKA